MLQPHQSIKKIYLNNNLSEWKWDVANSSIYDPLMHSNF